MIVYRDILYCSGFQNGSIVMMKRVAIKEIGMVDVTIANRIDGNCIHMRMLPEGMENAENTYHVRISPGRTRTVSNAPRMFSKPMYG